MASNPGKDELIGSAAGQIITPGTCRSKVTYVSTNGALTHVKCRSFHNCLHTFKYTFALEGWFRPSAFASKGYYWETEKFHLRITAPELKGIM